MAKTIANGRYLMGIELLGDHTANMVLVPMGGRNIPNWTAAQTMTQEDFQAFMRVRKERRAEAEQKRTAK